MISYYQKYYLEIKNRLFLLLFAWLFSVLACYINKEALLFILIDFTQHLNVFDTKPYFIFTNITEIFQVYLELTIFFSNQIVLTMIGYHIIMFLSLGLYKFEFLKLKVLYHVFLFSWLFSILLLCKFIMPFSWSFFLSFQENPNGIQPISFFFEAKVIDYINYFIDLYYICFINCQFLSALTFILINMSERLREIKKFRKLFYLIFIAFSTIITPPDIISQIVVSSLLIISYEMILFVRYLKDVKPVTN